jgi:hypothetical protein
MVSAFAEKTRFCTFCCVVSTVTRNRCHAEERSISAAGRVSAQQPRFFAGGLRMTPLGVQNDTPVGAERHQYQWAT